ncbi:MAG: hypothetical protein U1F36_09585 [Planctomycetota bacterium]
MFSSTHKALAGATLSLLLSAALHAQAGSVIGSFPTPSGIVPSGLGPDGSGNLIITGTGTGKTIAFMTATGSVTGQFTPANSNTPTGVATDGIFLYVSDSSPLSGPNIDVYSMAGVYQRSFTVPATIPNGIVYTPQTGHLFINDFAGNVVWEYDTAGVQIGSFPLLGTLQMGLAHDPVHNEFWGYERGGDLIHQYDASFTELSNFPGPVSHGFSTGNGIALIGGSLFLVAIASRQVVIFDTTGNSAAVVSYGRGCPTQGVFYELWPTGTGDMAGRSIRFTAQGTTGWLATSGGTFETNLGTNLALGDDTILRSQALGFSFPLPSSPIGSTTAIDICSNGWVGPNPVAIPDTGFYTQCSGAELVKYERIALYWNDLNPATAGTGGGVFFNTLTNPTRAVITWNAVPTFGQNDSNTCQLQLYANGDMVMIWQSGCVVGTGQSAALAGYSPGHNAPDPGSIDLSATIPHLFGPYGIPLDLSASRPILGQPVNYVVSHVPAGAAMGVLLFGGSQVNVPLDLLNMPGCTLLCSGDFGNAPFSTVSGQLSLNIPSAPGLAGFTMTNQAVVVAAGVNPFGVIVSNGVALTLGF